MKWQFRSRVLSVVCALQSFVRAAEKYGRNETEKIAGEMEGKSREEVERYSKVGHYMCEIPLLPAHATAASSLSLLCGGHAHRDAHDGSYIKVPVP